MLVDLFLAGSAMAFSGIGVLYLVGKVVWLIRRIYSSYHSVSWRITVITLIVCASIVMFLIIAELLVEVIVALALFW